MSGVATLKATNATQASAGSIAVTFTPTTGAILAAFVCYDDGGGQTAAGVSDNINGSWGGFKKSIHDVADGEYVDCYVFPSAGAGSTTVTFTPTTVGRPAMAIAVYEITGCANGYDKSTGQLQATPGTGTDAITTGTFTATSQPYVTVAVALDTATGVTAPASGTGYTDDGAAWPIVTAGLNGARFEHVRRTSLATDAATFTAPVSVATVSLCMDFLEAPAAAVADSMFFACGSTG